MSTFEKGDLSTGEVFCDLSVDSRVATKYTSYIVSFPYYSGRNDPYFSPSISIHSPLHDVCPPSFVPQITPLTDNVDPCNRRNDESPYYAQLYNNEVEYELQSDAKYDYDKDHTEDGVEDEDVRAEFENDGGNGYNNGNEDEFEDQPENEGQPVNESYSVSRMHLVKLLRD